MTTTFAAVPAVKTRLGAVGVAIGCALVFGSCAATPVAPGAPSAPASSTSASAAPTSATVSPSSTGSPSESASASSSPSGSMSPSGSGSPSASGSSSVSGRPSASGSATASATVAPTDPLTFDGVGALKLGMPIVIAVRQGLVVPSEVCDAAWEANRSLKDQGVGIREGQTGVVRMITLQTGPHATQSGIKAGSSVSDLKRVYGEQVQLVQRNSVGGKRQVFVLTSGNKEIVFFTDGVADTSVVQSMTLAPTSDFVGFDGC